MDEFVENHLSQLQQLNIPSPLYDSLATQLQRTFVTREGDDHDAIQFDFDQMVQASYQNFDSISVDAKDYGCMLVLPHVCSWDTLEEPRRGLWNALQDLPTSVLMKVRSGLWELWSDNSDNENVKNPKDSTNGNKNIDRHDLINHICDDRTWSRVILYRHNEKIRAALPAPPYPPQIEVANESDNTEADLVGPFPFIYHMTLCKPQGSSCQEMQIDCSLAYLSPEVALEYGRRPTVDLVPAYSMPNSLTRAVRYAALLGNQAPTWCLVIVKEAYAAFVKKMHLVRQRQLELKAADDNNESSITTKGDQTNQNGSNRVWKVYTDSDDPMELAHPEAGLNSPQFALTGSMEDADIIYPYRSLFVPGEVRQFVEQHPNILINQFPFEGALVQVSQLHSVVLQKGKQRPSRHLNHATWIRRTIWRERFCNSMDCHARDGHWKHSTWISN
jgi:hypothetical protein